MIRHGTALAFVVALAACHPVPAHADALPPELETIQFPGSAERLAPGDPLGYKPAEFPRMPGGVSYYRIFDPPMRMAPTARPLSWNGAPRGFILPSTALSRWNGTPSPPPGLPPGWDRPIVPRPKPPDPGPGDAVPGPAPIAVAVGAFSFSRNLRRRMKT
jgi:hypothetical protein